MSAVVDVTGYASPMLAFLPMGIMGIQCHSMMIIPCCQKPRLREDKKLTEVTGAFGERNRFEYQEHCHRIQLLIAMMK